MLCEIVASAVLIALVILLSVKMYYSNHIFMPISNMDENIELLMKEFDSMQPMNRISVEICDEGDKLGEVRDNFNKEKGNNCEPLISRQCLYILDHILNRNSVGLEWSSGSSTIWLGRRMKHLLSIENSEEWSNKVKAIVKKRNLENRIKLLHFNNDKLEVCNNDDQYLSNFYSGGKTCFKTYITTDLIPNIEYDFISVDGRARPGCLFRVIKMLKPENGILLMDNTERQHYKWAIKKVPSNWSKYVFWCVNGETTLWISHK